MKNRMRVNVPTIDHTYRVSILDGRFVQDVPRETAAKLLKAMREAGETITLIHIAKRVDLSENLCAGCYARPSLWEYDCDGMWDTLTCGECDWWTAYRSRYGK